jgi:hypothetical protein
MLKLQCPGFWNFVSATTLRSFSAVKWFSCGAILATPPSLSSRRWRAPQQAAVTMSDLLGVATLAHSHTGDHYDHENSARRSPADGFYDSEPRQPPEPRGGHRLGFTGLISKSSLRVRSLVVAVMLMLVIANLVLHAQRSSRYALSQAVSNKATG